MGGSFSTSSYYGGDDYTLEFLGFGTIVGAGYTTVNQFHVLENERANAQLLGRITVAPATEAVPEPGTLALFGIGFLTLGFVSIRRRV